jgi:hypothetical protein
MAEYALEQALEWEDASPIVLECMPFPPHFIAGTKKVTVRRDENFRLRMLAEGVLADRNELLRRYDALQGMAAGTFGDDEDVALATRMWTGTLRAFFGEDPEATFGGVEPNRVIFRHEGDVQSFTRCASEKFIVDEYGLPGFVPIGPPKFCSDWFINGPHAPVWMRSTVRRRKVVFFREREFGSTQTEELPSGRGGADHLVIEGPSRFAICQVPKERAPDWCRPISIEYRTPIPDFDTREAVAELVSFVLGRRLISLGSTIHDETGWPIELRMDTVIGQNIHTLCSASEEPPIALGRPRDIEVALAKLVPAYLQARAAMGLRNALWGYWIACEAPPPIDLALFRTAVEALKKGWRASREREGEGCYMPKEDFDTLTGDAFAMVKEKLGTQPHAKEILNNLRGAYRMSGNEQVRRFFGHIGLVVGKLETKARQRANDPAHGTVTTGGAIREFTLHARAYRVLFVRVFLRLLGYDGVYVDYASPGFPLRPLNEPAGGEP